MCANYWNLTASFTCPNCGAVDEAAELQTHFMGDLSFDQTYGIGDEVPLLKGVTVTLDGRLDDFIGHCDECDASIDFAAEIVDGCVTRVWPYRHAVLA